MKYILPLTFLALLWLGACTVAPQEDSSVRANDDDWMADDDDSVANDDDDASPPDANDDDAGWVECPDICLSDDLPAEGPNCGYCGNLNECEEGSALPMTAEFFTMDDDCCQHGGLLKLKANVPPRMCLLGGFCTLGFSSIQASEVDGIAEIVWAIQGGSEGENPNDSALRHALGKAHRCGNRYWTQPVDVTIPGESFEIPGIEIPFLNAVLLIEFQPESGAALGRLTGLLDPAPLAEPLGFDACSVTPSICNEEGLVPMESADVLGTIVDERLEVEEE